MPARNALSAAPPHAVILAVARLGENLRTARLRRNLKIDDVAAKIGSGRRAVADTERGKATTSMAVYVACYGTTIFSAAWNVWPIHRAIRKA